MLFTHVRASLTCNRTGVGYAGAGSISDDSFFVTGGSSGVVRAWRCLSESEQSGGRDDALSDVGVEKSTPKKGKVANVVAAAAV